MTAAAESQVPDDQSRNSAFPSLKKKLLLRRNRTFNRSINNVNSQVDSKSYPPQLNTTGKIKEKNPASVKNKVLISNTTTITL